MRKSLGFLVFALLSQLPLLAATSTYFFTANQVARDCRAFIRTENGTAQESSARAVLDQVSSNVCVAYLQGAVDAFDLVKSNGMVGPNRKTVCVPEGVNGGQIVRIFLKYIDAHPEKLHLTASVTVWNSLVEAFPCH